MPGFDRCAAQTVQAKALSPRFLGESDWISNDFVIYSICWVIGSYLTLKTSIVFTVNCSDDRKHESLVRLNLGDVVRAKRALMASSLVIHVSPCERARSSNSIAL
jgi:hypothetical protein